MCYIEPLESTQQDGNVDYLIHQSSQLIWQVNTIRTPGKEVQPQKSFYGFARLRQSKNKHPQSKSLIISEEKNV